MDHEVMMIGEVSKKMKVTLWLLSEAGTRSADP
jgi:hypothetical protein